MNVKCTLEYISVPGLFHFCSLGDSPLKYRCLIRRTKVRRLSRKTSSSVANYQTSMSTSALLTAVPTLSPLACDGLHSETRIKKLASAPLTHFFFFVPGISIRALQPRGLQREQPGLRHKAEIWICLILSCNVLMEDSCSKSRLVFHLAIYKYSWARLIGRQKSE